MILKILQVSVLIVLFSVVPFSIGLTWEVDKRTELEPSLYYRKVPQNGFSSQNESSVFSFVVLNNGEGLKVHGSGSSGQKFMGFQEIQKVI